MIHSTIFCKLDITWDWIAHFDQNGLTGKFSFKNCETEWKFDAFLYILNIPVFYALFRYFYWFLVKISWSCESNQIRLLLLLRFLWHTYFIVSSRVFVRGPCLWRHKHYMYVHWMGPICEKRTTLLYIEYITFYQQSKHSK